MVEVATFLLSGCLTPQAPVIINKAIVEVTAVMEQYNKPKGVELLANECVLELSCAMQWLISTGAFSLAHIKSWASPGLIIVFTKAYVS